MFYFHSSWSSPPPPTITSCTVFVINLDAQLHPRPAAWGPGVDLVRHQPPVTAPRDSNIVFNFKCITYRNNCIKQPLPMLANCKCFFKFFVNHIAQNTIVQCNVGTGTNQCQKQYFSLLLAIICFLNLYLLMCQNLVFVKNGSRKCAQVLKLLGGPVKHTASSWYQSATTWGPLFLGG